MDTNSHGAAVAAVNRCSLVLVAFALACTGCKSAPPAKNPFAEREKSDQSAKQAAESGSAERRERERAPEADSAAAALAAEGDALTHAASDVALAAVGLGKKAQAAAKDAESSVKQAVAQTRSQAEQDVKQVAAQTLATAKSVAREAQAALRQQAIEALAAWPLVEAGPVLIVAIAEGDVAVRRAAATQLAERWPAAAGFPIDAAAERRAVALAELKKLWIAQYGEINDAMIAAKAETRQLITVTEEHAREVQQSVNYLQQADLSEAARREAIAELAATGPPLVAVLEQKLEAGGALPIEIYTDVLPGMVPAFAALARFSSSDVVQRRAAAAELAVQASTLVLSPLAVTRLADLIEAEKDPIVWRSALASVAADSRDGAIRIATMGLAHASADVRREACQHLAAHGDPRNSTLLLKTLDDPDATVVMAAVRALGAGGTLGDKQPLARLLDAPDKLLQLEAAISLARLRAEQGTAAVARLAADTDVQVRLRVAQAMGEVADPLFLPALVAMLSDQADVRRVAMISLVRVAGSDVAAPQAGRPLSDEEKAERWRFWYQKHQTPTETARRP